jgi:hypothetical protein
MELDETKDEIKDEIKDETEGVQEEKPKKRKSRSRKATEPIEAEGAQTDKVEETEPKKKKTGSGKKKKSAPKKKAQGINEEITEIPIVNKAEIVEVKVQVLKKESKQELAVETQDSPEAVNRVILDPEPQPQPMGQAKVSNVKVEVLAKPAPVEEGFMQQRNMFEEPMVTTLKGGKVQIEPLSVNQKVEITQNAVLPFSAIKVRNVVGKIVNLVTDIIPNKVIVQGVVHEQVFFVGTDGIVHHLGDDVPFSTFLDIPGAQPGMNAQVTGIIEEIIPELAANGLSITKKIIIEVFVKVTETVQVNLSPGNGPTLLLRQVVGENTVQTLIEADVTLNTPAIKIDQIVGKILNVETEVIPDKVIIQGILHKQIFFVGIDNIERHQAEDLPFSTFVDIPGVQPGMDVQVHPRIEAIFFNLISPTTLRQKAVLEFFVKVTENIRQSGTLGNGPLFKTEEFIGENSVQSLSETLVTLSTPAIKVREIVAQIRDVATHVIPDKVIVQGTIHKQIFFIGIDNIEHHQAEDIPFSLFADIPGAEPGDNIHITPIIEAVFFELLSRTELRQKVIIKIIAVVAREIQLNLVLGDGLPLIKIEQVVGENTKQVLVVRKEEIVPPVSPITITTATIVFPAAEVIGRKQIILRNTFELPVTAIKIKEIQAVITDLTAKVIIGGVVVEGILDKTIFFVGTDNIVRSINERIPFSILVNVPGISPAQAIETIVNIENISFSLNAEGNTVTQVVVLEAVVEATEPPPPSVTVVTDVTGPGIMTKTVRVRALVLTPGGAVFQEFNVVTDVSGPGIISVTKQVVLLDVVGDGNPNPVPVEVVTNVQFA